jgi:hypothetical protein
MKYWQAECSSILKRLYTIPSGIYPKNKRLVQNITPYIVISMGAGKAFDRMQQSFMV